MIKTLYQGNGRLNKEAKERETKKIGLKIKKKLEAREERKVWKYEMKNEKNKIIKKKGQEKKSDLKMHKVQKH